MKYFLGHISGNPKVEFIHVSQDEDTKDAIDWAKSAQFPWLTVPSAKIKAAGLDSYDGGTPSYALVNKHGRVLATTEEAAMAKIKELTEK